MHRLTFVKCPKCREVTRQKVISSETNSKKKLSLEQGYVWFVNIDGILFKHQKE